MATKIEIKKADVGYTNQLPRCASCRAFSSKMMLPAWMAKENAASAAKSGECPYPPEKYSIVEKSMRCSIHGFAIQRSAVCNLWNPKLPL